MLRDIEKSLNVTHRQAMPANSYLEEYRRKYQPISSPRELIQPSSCETDIPTLLQRYLGDEYVPLHSDAHIQKERKDIDPPLAEDFENKLKKLTETSNSEDDIFDDDDLNNALLLPTSTLNNKLRITVDEVLKKNSSDKKTDRSFRRHSNPHDLGSVRTSKGRRYLSRTASATSEEFDFYLADGTVRGESDLCLAGLLHRDSSISSRSLESTASTKSNRSFKGDIVYLSDEDFDFDLEIDLNSSKQSDSDSQKLFSQFLIDSDSQKDGESIAGFDEVDGRSCHVCHPTSARSSSSTDSAANLCAKCLSKRTERQATIKEILDSELSYCHDLKLIKQHFNDALLSNGLLSVQEVHTIFGNVGKLIDVSKKFISQLENHIKLVSEDGDEHYNEVKIGRLICESSAMFLAFETYCLHYNTAITLIEQLRKENLLFNLFLQASLKDNAALRRIDLKTFLMIPVQRIMKYPLLLKRLHKATHHSHADRSDIAKANDKITNILHHINSQSKVLTSMSSNTKDSKSKNRTSFEIALTKLVLDTLNWRHDEIHFIKSGKIGYLQPGESQWAEKLKTSRYNTAYAVVVTRGRDDHPQPLTKRRLLFPKPTNVTSAVLLLIKKGSSRLQILGEPCYLSNCLVSRNTEFYDVFEVQESCKEPVILRPASSSETWYLNLKYYSLVLGGRKQMRRGALSNILLHT